MNVLERQITYGPFLERLRSAPARVLLVDYDGTLAPFCVDRTPGISLSRSSAFNRPHHGPGNARGADQRTPGPGIAVAQRDLTATGNMGKSRPGAADVRRPIPGEFGSCSQGLPARGRGHPARCGTGKPDRNQAGRSCGALARPGCGKSRENRPGRSPALETSAGPGAVPFARI